MAQILLTRIEVRSVKSMEQQRMSAISASEALRIALEDSQTIHFIKTIFSIPEERPEIVFYKWLSREGVGRKWKVAVVERPQDSFHKKMKLLNMAIIELDFLTGRITKRQFLPNILEREFRERFYEKQRRSLSFLPGGCRAHGL